MPDHATPPELVILRELLAHAPHFVSGSVLAEKLSISRVAIWQHMEKLRSQGFEFEAVRARGYRLTRQPQALNATLMEALLPEPARACGLVLLDAVDSTNDEAARLLAAGHPAPFVVLARRQAHGRGRFGRPWDSDQSGNVYASFGFRPTLPPERMATFTVWMGVHVGELIAAFSQTTPELKWPNELLFHGRKAGGMLTEARIDSDQIRDLVFGLGLNVNAPVVGDPATRATSLAEQTTRPLDLNRFTAALITGLLAAYHDFVAGRQHATLPDRWQRFDLLRGKNVTVLHGATRVTGLATGIDATGALLLRDPHGRIQRFRAGEVTLEKSPGEAPVGS